MVVNGEKRQENETSMKYSMKQYWKQNNAQGDPN
jgi:hypothetical protein